MKGEEFLDILGNMNEKYILEAAETGEYIDIEEHGGRDTGDKRRAWWKWAALAAGFLLAAGAAVWFGLSRPGKTPGSEEQENTAQSGKMNGQEKEQESTAEGGKTNGQTADTSAGSVYIPALEIEPKEEYATSDMIALVIYHGAMYTYAGSYEGEAAERIRGLLGECVGTAAGNIDEWSDKSAYQQELAGTVNGKIYTVKGYDPDFRLCHEIEISEEIGGGYAYTFLERLNGITLSKGKELFEDRLHLSENTERILWVSHAAWDAGTAAKEEAAIPQELWNRFLSEVDQAGFVDAWTPFIEEKEDIHSTEQAHLTIKMKDGTETILRLFAGGYVGYQGLNWYYVKIPGETFDEVFALARGEEYISGKDSGGEE